MSRIYDNIQLDKLGTRNVDGINAHSQLRAIPGTYLHPSITFQVNPKSGMYESSCINDWVTRTAENSLWRSIVWANELTRFVAVNASGSQASIYSSNGITWSTSQILLGVNEIVWAPELTLFFVCGQEGSNRSYVSTNGITFTTISTPTNPWIGAVWAPELTLFVAVGSGAAGQRVMTSSNGLTWTTRSSPQDNTWNAIAWAPQLTRFVAVASTGTNRVMTSSDGITWLTAGLVTVPTSAWFDVEWAPELTLFVAIANSGTARIMISSDGLTWSTRPQPVTGTWRGLSWAPEIHQFVAVQNGSTVISSYEGLTWISHSAPNLNWFAIEYSPSLNLFAAVSSGSTPGVMTSQRGIAFTVEQVQQTDFCDAINSYTNVSSLGQIVSTTPANNRLSLNDQSFTIDIGGVNKVTIDSTSNTTNTLVQGIPGTYYDPSYAFFADTNTGMYEYACIDNWTTRVSLTSTWRSIVWANELTRFVAVNASGAQAGIYSSDGITWSTSQVILGVNEIVWAPELTLFFVCGQEGSNRSYFSRDGITFTTISTPTNPWIGAVWAPELTLFVAVGSGAAGQRVMTSSNGLTWTTRASPQDNTWNAIAWAPQLTRFVAVASTGTDRVMTSSDGITWLTAGLVTVPTSAWFDVEWAPELTLFVAIANSGTVRIMISSDGLIWSTRPQPVTGTWRGLSWAPEIHQFVAVQNGSAVMSSYEGLTWISHSCPNFNWIAIDWSPTLNLFAAVNNNGASNIDVMTSQRGFAMTSETHIPTSFCEDCVVDGPLTVEKSAVVQQSTINTSVTLNFGSGVITTVSSTLAALSTTTFTVNNFNVVPKSVITTQVVGYTGTGNPYTNVSNITFGAFDIVLMNLHTTNALSSTVQISFMVV